MPQNPQLKVWVVINSDNYPDPIDSPLTAFTAPHGYRQNTPAVAAAIASVPGRFCLSGLRKASLLAIPLTEGQITRAIVDIAESIAYFQRTIKELIEDADAAPEYIEQNRKCLARQETVMSEIKTAIEATRRQK